MTSASSIYQNLSGMVLGFHGCDVAVGETLLHSQDAHLRASHNVWDWLGGGIYFWENDPMRALEFAELKRKFPGGGAAVNIPFVIGAIIDLKLCCSLTDRKSLQEVKTSFDNLQHIATATGAALPENRGINGVYRDLDCAWQAVPRCGYRRQKPRANCRAQHGMHQGLFPSIFQLIHGRVVRDIGYDLDRSAATPFRSQFSLIHVT